MSIEGQRNFTGIVREDAPLYAKFSKIARSQPTPALCAICVSLDGCLITELERPQDRISDRQVNSSAGKFSHRGHREHRGGERFERISFSLLKFAFALCSLWLIF
jgi:hypothetical protein